MNLFEELLSERYINAFSNKEKEIYKNDVWKMIQAAYAPIGGHKGKEFASPDTMVRMVPMWKLVKKNNIIVAAALYKDSGGRKRIAIATDGSDEGRMEIRKLVADDFSRSFVEVSGPSFFSMSKHLGDDFLVKYAKTRAQAHKILGDQLFTPDPTDPMVVKTPALAKYMYSRMIGGHKHTKIMLGTSGKVITI